MEKITQAERLTEIETSHRNKKTYPDADHVEWLIARVKRLTEKLDLIKNCIPAENLNAQEHVHIWNCVVSEIRRAQEEE